MVGSLCVEASKQLVKQCTPEVEIYLTRSVPPENLKAAIAVAKEFE